jgi:hypothetical protein
MGRRRVLAAWGENSAAWGQDSFVEGELFFEIQEA